MRLAYKELASEQGIKPIEGPFIPSVSLALGFLLRAIEDVKRIDTCLGHTLSDITGDLVGFLEEQTMLMFQTWGVDEQSRCNWLKSSEIDSLLTDFPSDAGETLNCMDKSTNQPNHERNERLDNVSRHSKSRGGSKETDFEDPVRSSCSTPCVVKARTEYAHTGKKLQNEAHRLLSATMYQLSESVCATVDAQSVTAYYYTEHTNMLHVVASAPDLRARPASAPHSFPAHLGLIGEVFTKGIALHISDSCSGSVENRGRLSILDELYGLSKQSVVSTKSSSSIDPTCMGKDPSIRVETTRWVSSALVFPITDGPKTIGALEVLKMLPVASDALDLPSEGTWTSSDEAFVQSVCICFRNIFTYYPADTVPSPIFRPHIFRSIRPWTTKREVNICLPKDLKIRSIKPQRILRIQRGHSADPPALGNIPLPTCNGYRNTQDPRGMECPNTASSAGGLGMREPFSAAKHVNVEFTSNLEDVHRYMRNLDESYNMLLDTMLAMENDSRIAQEELALKNQQVRVLEENIAYLNEQITKLKNKLSPHLRTCTGESAYPSEKEQNMLDFATDLRISRREVSSQSLEVRKVCIKAPSWNRAMHPKFSSTAPERAVSSYLPLRSRAHILLPL